MASAVHKEFNAQQSYFTFRVSPEQIPPAELGLILGDFLTNARAALDHVAWELVRTGSNPSPDRAHLVQFPICVTSDSDFDGRRSTQLPGVGDEVVAIIRRYQPYIRGQFTDTHPLAILNRLVRQDKHHEFHLALMQAVRLHAEVVAAQNFTPTRVEPGGVLMGDVTVFAANAEVVRVYGTAGPDELGPSDVTLRLKSEFSMALEDGLWINPALRDIHAMVVTLLSELHYATAVPGP